MRRFLPTLVIALMFTVSFQKASADVPQVITYQGRLTNADGQPLPNGMYELAFTLYPDSLLPDFLWQEVQLVEVVGGLFDVQLGEDVPLPFGPFIEIVPPNLYLGITLAGNPEMQPRIKLSSSPYAFKAFHADEAAWAGFSDGAGIAMSVADSCVTEISIRDGSIGLNDIGQNGASPGQIIKWTPDGWDIGYDESGPFDDGDWTLVDYVLSPVGKWGLASAGNVLYGSHDTTHINFGTACTTGTSGFSEWYVTVSGGYGNTATSVGGTISGGYQNRASGTGASVSGGITNYATRTGATVGGGGSNYATGINATVAGGNINMAAADFTTVAGGIGNQATDTIASVLGGQYNYATGVGSTIAGGSRNAAHGQYSFVGGGGGVNPDDSNAAIGDWSFVGAGRQNVASGYYSAVVGGVGNKCRGNRAVIGGGGNLSADSNAAHGDVSFIGGGSANITSSSAVNSVICGGAVNRADDFLSTVGGGGTNIASARASTVCGGELGRARGSWSVVSGGGGSTYDDTNSAIGDCSVVPGGQRNVAQGDYSLAAGRRAQALHDGCFIWADATDSDASTARANEFFASVDNGMRVLANNPSLYAGYFNNEGTGDGIRALTNTSSGDDWAAVYAYNYGASSGIYAYSSGGYAGYFDGNIYVTGSVITPGSSYKIDHPNDPTGKYLAHGYVGSSEQKNVYDGVIVLGAAGDAWVELPDWFEALNGDFRYQLTAIGAPGPNLYIAEEISGNRFKIAGGTSGMKVSWQVTGIRMDAYSDAHPLEVEQVKISEEYGKYLHPEEHGMSAESGINYRAHEEKISNSQEMR